MSLVRFEGGKSINAFVFSEAWDNETQNYSRKRDNGLRWDGVDVSQWDGIEISADVPRETLVSIIGELFVEARTRENAYNRSMRHFDSATRAFAAVGEVAKAAAIAQQWCNEYEDYCSKIAEVIPNASWVKAFTEGAERRTKYSVTIEALANSEYAVRDALYSIANRHNGGSENYGVQLNVTGEEPVALAVVNDTVSDETL